MGDASVFCESQDLGFWVCDLISGCLLSCASVDMGRFAPKRQLAPSGSAEHRVYDVSVVMSCAEPEDVMFTSGYLGDNQ